MPQPAQTIWSRLPVDAQGDDDVRAAFGEIQAAFATATALPEARLKDLRETLDRFLPKTVAAREARIDATAKALHQMGVNAIDLPGLISTSRIRDGVRHWTAVLRTGLSFLPAAGAGLGLALDPAYDKAEYAGDKADDVAERNIYVAYGIGLLCMGVGGQLAARVVEDGGLGPKYNKPAPVQRDGKSVPYADTTRAMVAKGFEFYPFAAGHSTAGSGVLELSPEGTARAFLLSTLFSSMATGMSSALFNEVLPPEGLDYTWLDASTPEKAKDMQAAVEYLKEGSLVALGGYAKDVGKGIKGLVGLPGKQALKGAAYRLIAAAIATLPRLFYASTKTEHDKAMFGIIAGLWIGLTWGWLGMALFQPVKDPNAKPAARATVEEVLPPSAQQAASGHLPDGAAAV